MASKKTKIYFWLKIDRNFYKNMFIKKLRTIPGGDTYVVIYQRMLVEWVEDNGFITFEGLYDTIAEEIAIQLDEDLTAVQFTLDYFIKYGLIQLEENGDIKLNQVEALIDSETNWARYKKKNREIGNNPTKLENVQPMSNQCPTEIEKDIELEKELEIDKDKDKDIDKNQKTNPSISQSQNSNNHIGAFQYIESVTNRSFSAIAKDELLELINDFGNEAIVQKIENRNQDDKFNGSSPIGVIRYIRKALTEDEKDKAKQAESDKKYDELFGDNVGEVSDDWMK